jgi:hypothetical protein
MVAVYKTVGHQQPDPLVGADAVPSTRLRTVAGQMNLGAPAVDRFVDRRAG